MPELNITIGNRPYRLAVSDGEQPLLEACAQKIDHEMKQIREGGKVSNPDQIAVLAALSIAYDAQQSSTQRQALEEQLATKTHEIEELKARIEELEHLVPRQGETLEDKSQQLIGQKIDQITKKCQKVIFQDVRTSSLFQP